jgi:hypothetical protein
MTSDPAPQEARHVDGEGGGEKASDGWQPMETAPRDGSVILIRTERGGVEAAYWNLAPSAVGADRRYPWTFLDPTNGTNSRMDGDFGPTHWQPLPSAALAAARGEQP